MLRQRDGEHGAADTAGFTHQPAPRHDEVERSVEREHTGEVCGDVLAEAVTDERRGRDAPGHPLPGERDGREEHRRQRGGRLAQRRTIGASRRSSGSRSMPERAWTRCDAVTHDGVEHIEPVVEAGAHPDVLRSAAREHERDALGVGRGDGRGDAVAIAGAEGLDGRRHVGGDDHPAMGHVPAPVDERVGDIGEVRVGMGLEVRGEALRAGVDGVLVPPRDDEHLLSRRDAGGGTRRRLLHDHVGVRAPDAQRAHAGAARTVARPRRRLGRDDERRPLEIEQRARTGVVGQRRQRAVAARPG